MALVEWHLTPDYINNRWTEELLALMFQKRNARNLKMKQLQKGEDVPRPQALRRISNQSFFAKHGIKVKEV